MDTTPRISLKEFDWDWFENIKIEKLKVGNNGSRRDLCRYFKDIVTAFDIETTKIYLINNQYVPMSLYYMQSKEDLDKYGSIQSVLYIWQWQFGDKCTVIGRTWEEFIEFCAALNRHLKPFEKLVVYDHNLSYEFQFIKGIYEFKSNEIFAVDRRKILKFTMHDKALEFRCSYLQSNMSLDMFTEKMGVDHKKLSGVDFNYNKERFPWTEMSDFEMDYACNDVMGLVEAIETELELDNDTITSIPLTSTGYVRRDTKKAMRKYRYTIQDLFPDPDVYEMLREEFRGGDCHANRYYAGILIEEPVYSDDRCSSYPDVQCNCEFPMSKFFIVQKEKVTIDDLFDLIDRRHKAVLFRAAFSNIRLKDPFFGCPYLSKSKCRNIEQKTVNSRLVDNAVYDNGRILECSYMETTLNDIDFEILLKEYEWDDMYILKVAHARYAKLPIDFVRVIQSYFKGKTELKGILGMEKYYDKSKNLLNGIFGMTAQNPVIESLIFDGTKLVPDSTKSIEEKLAETKRNAFIVYQWGCWTTAHARYRLHEMIWLVGDNFIYSDTDSVKHFEDLSDIVADYNKMRIADSEASGSFAKNPKGEIFYMGVYECDAIYDKFITFGAKKYAYIKKGESETKITIAGVPKKLGASFINERGGIEALKEGFTFDGKSSILYNDITEPFTVQVPGGYLKITSNAVITDTTYVLGVTEEYREILKNAEILLTVFEKYNIMKTGRRQYNH